MRAPSTHLITYLITYLIVISRFGPLGAAMAAMPAPRSGFPGAAIFPPWRETGQVLASAGEAGRAIRFGVFRRGEIVLEKYRTRLRRRSLGRLRTRSLGRGAWLCRDPRAGCSRSSSDRKDA